MEYVSGRIMEQISLDRLVQELSSEHLIFIGDIHFDNRSRNNEIKLIDALSSIKPVNVLSEFFNYTTKPLFEAYRLGEIDKDNLFKKLNSVKDTYDKEYMDFVFPILEKIRSKNCSLIPIGNYSKDHKEYENKMMDMIDQNLDGDQNIVLIGQAHIRELGIPYKFKKLKSIQNKTISQEPNHGLDSCLKNKKINQGIIRIDKPVYGNIDYLFLGKI